MKVNLVSLGCARNLIDSEVMLGKLSKTGWLITQDPNDAEDYLMDHSSITYLMGPDGLFLQHFSYDASADTVADGLRKILDETGG